MHPSSDPVGQLAQVLPIPAVQDDRSDRNEPNYIFARKLKPEDRSLFADYPGSQI